MAASSRRDNSIYDASQASPVSSSSPSPLLLRSHIPPIFDQLARPPSPSSSRLKSRTLTTRVEMAYALSSETGSATPNRPLLSVNPLSVCVRSLPCVHCPIHVTPSACLLIHLVDTAPPVARHISAPPSCDSFTHPGSRPHPLVVRPAYSPLATPDRHWIEAFPLAAKSTCPSHPKTVGPGSNIAPVALADIKKQDTVALRSTRRASPLAIAPRGLGLVSV